MNIIYIPFKKKTLIFWLISIVIAVGLIVFLLYNMGSKSVFKTLLPDPIYKGNEDIKGVAFACNVVWGTEYLPDMLEIFREKDIEISFFIGGEWADDNPEVLKSIVKEGHELGNHGYYHKHHSQLSLEQNMEEIRKTENSIKDICGVKTTLFAPPYGEFNDTTLQAANSLGYKTIMWSIDTIDWRREGSHIILERILKDPHNGAIILMHPVDDTVVALPDMIDGLREKGFKIGKVSDLLK